MTILGLALGVLGLIPLAFGILYLKNPNVFRRGIWIENSIAVRTKTPEEYEGYMRGQGRVWLTAGIIIIVCGVLVMLFGR